MSYKRIVKVSESGDLRTRPKPEVEAQVEVGEGLTHVPALLSELFDYPRSTARMQMALGNVSLNGEKLGVENLDMPESELLGGTLRCCQHTAILRGTRPEAVMKSSRMDDAMVMGGT